MFSDDSSKVKKSKSSKNTTDDRAAEVCSSLNDEWVCFFLSRLICKMSDVWYSNQEMRLCRGSTPMTSDFISEYVPNAFMN